MNPKTAFLLVVFVSIIGFSKAFWFFGRRRRSCATHACEWHWGSCNKPCGTGYKYPVKTKTQGSCGSCDMPSRPMRCNTQCCVVHCSWNAWGSWGSCSRRCGGGTQTRTRGKSSPSCGGKWCTGSSSETRQCNQQCCPVHCSWGPWGDWGSCSANCGGGKMSRIRGYAIAASCGGNPCLESPNESQDCNTQCCPVNCNWAAWSTWGSCSVSCGGGGQSRSRGQNPIMSCGGTQCQGESTEQRQCNQGCCPVDCTWENWGSWGGCSETCGGGLKTRSRGISVPMYCGGSDCKGPKKQNGTCNTQCCPVDCKWSTWGSWGTCSKTCERGTQSRKRFAVTNKTCGGATCPGESVESRNCNDVCCPVHCQWQEWSGWTGCTKSCGNGTQQRHRTEKVDSVCRGEECRGAKIESRECNTMCCPVDCVLSNWEPWSECSASCGVTGHATRTRKVDRPLECEGEPCDTTLQELRPCNRVCFNGGTFGNSACDCKSGWKGICCEHDVNECSSVQCPLNSRCMNTEGSYSCVCNHGYSDTKGACLDIDGCALQQLNCHAQAECVNRDGHYICNCIPGFTGDGVNCTDIDECLNDYAMQNYTRFDEDLLSTLPPGTNVKSPLCGDNAHCSNAYGNYSCECDAGYSGDGFNCTDIDECSLPFMLLPNRTSGKYPEQQMNAANQSQYLLVSCDENAYCINFDGSYDCLCNDGYFGNGYVCYDIHECNNGTHNCQAQHARCIKTVGSHKCVCKDGFSGDGRTCIDVDECANSSTNNCNQTHGICENNEGSFTCSCRQGFRGDGVTCEDVDECSLGFHTCSQHHQCRNTTGSYVCECVQGSTQNDNGSCTDIDECALGSHNCKGQQVTCVNTFGSFVCSCGGMMEYKDGVCKEPSPTSDAHSGGGKIPTVAIALSLTAVILVAAGIIIYRLSARKLKASDSTPITESVGNCGNTNPSGNSLLAEEDNM